MRLAPLFVLVPAFFVLSGCAATSPPVPADPALDMAFAPAWVDDAIGDEPVMSALGTATGIDDPGALRRTALSNARARMARQIAKRVKPVLDGHDALEAASRDDVAQAIVAINLYGPHRERFWVGPSGTCYVRYEIPLETYEHNVLALHRVDEAVRETVVAEAWSTAVAPDVAR